jgi:hypothetical protein
MGREMNHSAFSLPSHARHELPECAQQSQSRKAFEKGLSTFNNCRYPDECTPAVELRAIIIVDFPTIRDDLRGTGRDRLWKVWPFLFSHNSLGNALIKSPIESFRRVIMKWHCLGGTSLPVGHRLLARLGRRSPPPCLLPLDPQAEPAGALEWNSVGVHQRLDVVMELAGWRETIPRGSGRCDSRAGRTSTLRTIA